jgi:arylsulfatase A-like enzyme
VTINRRDFLKISALLSASSVLRPGLELFPTRLSDNPKAKNILIIVFDTLSARHINFYGYPRETMPKLTKLLPRATVYHNHYASSNFTTPGTASLLTGRHVWEHLALKLTDSVREKFANQNIFSFFDDYFKIAYTHNYYADIFLSQFRKAITQHEFFKNHFLEFQDASMQAWIEKLFKNDFDSKILLQSRLNDKSLDGYLYSLLLPSLFKGDLFQPPDEVVSQFPRGIPMADKQDPFILEDGITWLIDRIPTLPQPFLGYFHFLPPHAPYNTRQDFVDSFKDDGYQHLAKQPDPYTLRDRILSYEQELKLRQNYDEFLLYVDSEFHRLFTGLDQRGILENTLLVLTTDHGELIERGVNGHNFPDLFEPLVNIPLVMFEPGQAERHDVHAFTSCIDLVPSLLQYTGHAVPSNLPGLILPPFRATKVETPRTIYTLHASKNKGSSHINSATLTMRKKNMKVIRYTGYINDRRYLDRAKKLNVEPSTIDPEFLVFDLEDDPEEVDNLASQGDPEIQKLIDELEQYYRDEIEFPE